MVGRAIGSMGRTFIFAMAFSRFCACSSLSGTHSLQGGEVVMVAGSVRLSVEAREKSEQVVPELVRSSMARPCLH